MKTFPSLLSAALKIAFAATLALGAAFFVLPHLAANDRNERALVPTPTAIPTRAESPAPRADAITPTPIASKEIHAYTAFDFLSNYLTNRSYPIIVEGKPWTNSSLNLAQYRDQFGGTTFWDFWGDDEQWETPNHQWQDNQGTWHWYTRETIKMGDGKAAPAFVLVDRPGPGVMDALLFTHDTIIWRGDILQHLKVLGTQGIEETVEWGGLQKLGNLRIEVDEQIVFDGAIQNWFSGKAQGLTPDLARIFVWRYRDFGSTGNIIPIPYQSRLKVLLYGGEAKPKWFMATGVTLPHAARVQPYRTADLAIDDMARLAQNVLAPETYIETLENQQSFDLRAQAGAPARIELSGAGTVEAAQFRIGKKADIQKLWLRVHYGDETGVDLPFIAFFGEPGQVSLHRSTPVGVIESGDAYLFYSNFPLPYQNGITIEISSASATPIAVSARIATSPETRGTQLRVDYKPGEKLRALSLDDQVRLTGNGKLVGIVLVTQDQDLRNAPRRFLPGGNQEDPATHSWEMGYLEANLQLADGAGNARVYNGHEDWAGGGYYFNLGYTTPSGGSNRPFGGILRFKYAEDGYATIFRYFNDLSAFRFKDGLTLSFGHGTWRNNYPVTFGTTVLYYETR